MKRIIAYADLDHNRLNISYSPPYEKWIFPHNNAAAFEFELQQIADKYSYQMIRNDTIKMIESEIQRTIDRWMDSGDLQLPLLYG